MLKAGANGRALRLGVSDRDPGPGTLVGVSGLTPEVQVHVKTPEDILRRKVLEARLTAG